MKTQSVNQLNSNAHRLRVSCSTLFLLIVLLVTSNANAVTQSCEKTVRWSNDPPYSMRDEKGEITGFYVDLIEAILVKMDCKIKLVEMPWARALLDLEAGRIDVLPGALKTAERQHFALFSDPINYSPNVLFMKKTAINKFKLKNLSDIAQSNFRLGIQVNIAYGAEFDELIKKPAFQKNLTTVYERNSGWKMIEINRIDGLIADVASGTLELKLLHLENTISNTNLIVSTSPAFFAFSKKTINQDFIEEFNQQLNLMMNNGSYAKIHEKHIPCKFSLTTLTCQ